MTKKKIAAFGTVGLAAFPSCFGLFAYYNFTHNFHIAISDQQASDIASRPLFHFDTVSDLGRRRRSVVSLRFSRLSGPVRGYHRLLVRNSIRNNF
jgi:hypothetical protein